MCGMCSDNIGWCDQTECGAQPLVDENGERRRFYLRHFYADHVNPDIPCKHVLAQHDPDCDVAQGWFCSCNQDFLKNDSYSESDD